MSLVGADQDNPVHYWLNPEVGLVQEHLVELKMAVVGTEAVGAVFSVVAKFEVVSEATTGVDLRGADSIVVVDEVVFRREGPQLTKKKH